MAKKAGNAPEEKAVILTAIPEWADAGAIGELVGLSERRIQQLTRSGVLEAEAPPGRKARKYRTRQWVPMSAGRPRRTWGAWRSWRSWA